MESALPPSNQPKKHSGTASLVTGLVLIALSALLWINHQYLIDTVRFWQYQPTGMVADIASRTTMTDSGKFLFYASQPSVDDRTTFNAACKNNESGTAILGCYTADRIYIYDITDQRLDGIQEVTAAHEMLHAVYARMSDSDKQAVNTLVEAEYQKLKANPDYTARMAFYDKTEPGERDNELHSIIGTEVGSISPELEAHYKKYFSNRAAIVASYNSYNSVFTSLEDQAKSLSTQLDALNAQIKTAVANYETDVKQLNADIASFNQRASSGDFSSLAAFNKEHQALVDRSDALSSERNSVNALIGQYNTLSDQYNSIVTQSNDLNQSIDSSLAPAPKV